jgi:superfamily II DNA or RNA helicase
MNQQRGIFELFCGTGKSLVMAQITMTMMYQNVLILFPTIKLVDQFESNWGDYIRYNTEMYLHGIHCHREYNVDVIEQHLRHRTRGNLILCTYQSYPKIKHLSTLFSMQLCDEAHHVCSKTRSIISSNGIMRQYYFTATPAAAMYDEERYGQILTRLNLLDAVNLDVITDY